MCHHGPVSIDLFRSSSGFVLIMTSGISDLAATHRTSADLERDLAERTAERDALLKQNAQLLSDMKEALERQTATADILKVIASSPDDMQPRV